MLRFRFAMQSAIKRAAHAVGLEVRYAFQNPSLGDPRVYARWLSAAGVTCVFDVGANIGQSAAQFARAFPKATIHSFEPFPAPFARLQEVAARNSGRVRPHQLACGDEDGTLDLVTDASSTSALNQIMSTGAAQTRAPTTVRIQVARIDTFCAQHDVPSIDLLKTDTEGFDAKVLAGARGMLSGGRVRCVVTEVGFLDDRQHTEFSSAYTLLRECGFELAGIYEITYLRSLACDFANALFVRRS